MIEYWYTLEELYLVWQRAQGMLMSAQDGLLHDYKLNSYEIDDNKIYMDESIWPVKPAERIYLEIEI